MILSKDTRHLLKVGTKLKNGDTIYIITGMWEGKYKGSLYITIQNIQAGWKLYGEPSSHLYGMEIVKEEKA